MIELNKQTMCVGEQSIAAFSPAYCESDIIVPDVKPDIVKVLQCDATSVIGSKTCGSNRATVEGKSGITVLYLGEDGAVHSINTVEKFSHLIDMPGVADNMTAEAEAEVESVECTVLNSRKLMVKVLMGVDINVYATVEAEVCTEMPESPPFETLCRTLRPFSVVSRSCEHIVVKERIEVPSGKPSIGCILRVDSRITSKECSIISNKVVIKGTLCVTTLYKGDMDDCGIQHMRHEIPFTEVLEVDGAREDMTFEVRCAVENTYYDVMEDSDGDMRNICIECIIQVNVKVCNETEITIVEDAYSTQDCYNTSHGSTSVQRLVADAKNNISLKDSAQMPADSPEIMQVLSVESRPVVGTTKIEGGRVVIEGVIDSNILYLSSDTTSPINSHKHECRFSNAVDVNDITEDMICDISLETEHVNYNITASREIELRFGLAAEIKVISSDRITYLSGMEKSAEEQPASRGCCIKVYFVKKGDTLWGIAKRYNTTCQSIMSSNGLTSDGEIMPGKQLIIV